jgi:ferredoxin--NADP+ reductase
VQQHLPRHEYLGEQVRSALVYCPTVTREPFHREGRVTDLIDSGKLSAEIGLPSLNPTCDRVMICGSSSMLKDTCMLLYKRGFQVSGGIGRPGDYVIERAFAEK